MKNFEGISFLWAVGLLALIGTVYALRAFLGYRNVTQDAEQDYDYKKEHKMLDRRIGREGYIRVFKRLHNPRRPAYIAATVFAIFYHRLAPGTPKYEIDQQIKEEETGERDTPTYDNDWGLPPCMIIGGVLFGFVSVAYRIVSKAIN